MKKTRVKRVSPRRRATAELDALVKQIIMIRDGGRCRRCGSMKQLQAAHVLPKGKYPSLRHDPVNLLVLCWYCHLGGPHSWHRDPVGAIEWFTERMGTEFVEDLKLRALLRKPKKDYGFMKLYLEQELANMQRCGS
jgi:hypothetical protein